MFAMTTHPRTVYAWGRPDSGLFDAVLSDWLGSRRVASRPAVARARLEVSEHDDRYEVRAELPGARKDAITIDVQDSHVSIAASAQAAAPAAEGEPNNGERLLYSERGSTSFARSFELPQAIDSAAAKATFENGVLSLSLPKKEAPKARRVAIQ